MGSTQIRSPVEGRLSPPGVASGGRSCWATWRKALKRKSRTLSPWWPPGPGLSPGFADWWRRCGGAAPPGPRVPGGAAVPLRGCAGRRVRPLLRLVVRGVMGGVVWDGGGGRCCRVLGLVMGFLVAEREGGLAVCVGGGMDINRLVGASVCCVCGLVSGGGRGGCCGGGTVGGWGGGGGSCAGRGSGRPCGSCGCCLCAPCGLCGPWLVAVLGCGWEVAAWASGWGCGPYVMGGCRWMVLAGMGCGWGGCWWWWGAPTRPWCC